MINSLLYYITGNMPCKLIKLSGKDYIERYYVGSLFDYVYYLHRYLDPDGERHVHNHPWKKGYSIILLGWYVEQVVLDLCSKVGGSGCITEITFRRWFNTVHGNTFHCIIKVKPKTWVLFFHNGPALTFGNHGAHKGWGFLEYHSHPESRTVYREHESTSESKWWLTASRGRDIGRAKL